MSPPTADAVRLSTQGAVAHLVLDDGRGNVLGSRTLRQLAQALDEASRADAVMLTGRAGIFCGGLDLEEIADMAPACLSDFLDLLYTTRRALFSMERPLVVAAAGSAIGAGAALLCCGDVRLGASDRGMVGFTEARLGAPLEISGLVIAHSVLGPAATPALMFGDLASKDEARTLGFFHRLTAPQDLLAEAHAETLRAAGVSRAACLIKRELRKNGLHWMGSARADNHASFVAEWTGAHAQVRIQALRLALQRKSDAKPASSDAARAPDRSAST
jgi:enoyl-CoA hydratase/carnithine racemase